MNVIFLNYLANCHNKALRGRARQNFLKNLRDNPEIVAWWIINNLQDWCGAKTVIPNRDEVVAQIVSHFRRYFNEEIQALPTATPANPSPVTA